jgi:large subunit ribosomal protein L17
MRHRNAGFKLGRNTSHRRAVLRNLVTSVILMDRIETTITKCKAAQPLVEKMITLGKRGTVHTRRQALSYLMTPESVDRLFNVVAPRYGDRNGGYTRITRSYVRQGDAAEMANRNSMPSGRSVRRPAPRSARRSPSRWKSRIRRKLARLPRPRMNPKPRSRHQAVDSGLIYRSAQVSIARLGHFCFFGRRSCVCITRATPVLHAGGRA